MKKILVPIDFSDFAQDAYEFACEIAYNTDGEVKLLHVVEYPSVSSFNTAGEVSIDQMKDPYMITVVKKAKSELEKSTFNKKFSTIKITYEVRVGNPYENIANVIEQSTSDLVCSYRSYKLAFKCVAN